MKQRLLDVIWTDFVQIYTNINYSSLYAETLREKLNFKKFFAIYVCFSLPAVLSLIINRWNLANDWLFILVVVLVLVIPLIVRYKNKELIYRLFGIYDNNIKELLKLNEELDAYKDAMLALYFKIEQTADKTNKLPQYEQEYKNLKLSNAKYMTRHDELTGKIDDEIQAQAQEKTTKMIENSNYYGREYTTEG